MGFLNVMGKYMQVKHSGSGLGQYMTLETLAVDAKVTNYIEPEDQFLQIS